MIPLPLAGALGWTLLHSLWEGAVIALALCLTLLGLHSSRARYLAACGALALVFGTFLWTLKMMMPGVESVPMALTRSFAAMSPDGASAASRLVSTAQTNNVLAWLAPIWMAGVILFYVRSFVSWMAAQRLRRRGVCCAPEPWPSRLRELAARLRISRPVKLMETCLADAPVVIGYLRPVILVPVGMLAGMPGAQIEAILLHELGHIGRYDYLANLLQMLVEGVLFYHPAVWWISHVVREEREHCCDDIAVECSGDTVGYATALTALEEFRWATHQVALAAHGGHLMNRICRVIDPLARPRTRLSPVLAAAFLSIAGALALFAWQTSSVPPMQPPAVMPTVPRPELTPRIRMRAQVQASPSAVPARPPAATTGLEQPWRKWMDEDVAYIISEEERSAFLSAADDAEREAFVERFWLQRDPTPGTAQNEFKEEIYRRIAYANDHFTGSIPGWKTDRGRIYIVYGPPDQIEAHETNGVIGQPPSSQKWRYPFIPGMGSDVLVEFVDTLGNGDYPMTRDPNAR